MPRDNVWIWCMFVLMSVVVNVWGKVCCVVAVVKNSGFVVLEVKTQNLWVRCHG